MQPLELQITNRKSQITNHKSQITTYRNALSDLQRLQALQLSYL